MDLSRDAMYCSSGSLSSPTTSALSDVQELDSDTDVDFAVGSSTPYQGLQSELDGNDLEAIAICGFSFKFPQDATSADSFWQMLREKRCTMTEFPKDRLNVDGFHSDKNANNTIPNRGGHFIREDIGAFDAEFFDISPAEAASMDPMQRLLLETTYRALENAGMSMEQMAGTATSVFSGSFGTDYMLQLARDAEQPPTYAASGLNLSMLANRISWYYNLCGPSVGVDSACSSSAMALDLACQSLRSRSCTASLVCGSTLIFGPEPFTWMSNLNALSSRSRCHSFDHRANGYARGEGVGVLVLKRLTDAIRDGDTIRAVVRSTGSNEDGKTPGISQPSRRGQEKLITETYQKAGLSMAHTRYFEAHGTGTAVGDPTEAQAIGSAFQKFRSNDDPLFVGAVKSNIGHLEGASGIAGIIKAILVLEKAIIPPNSGFEKANPAIDVEYLKIKFPERCEPWPSSGLRRASISSFGFGGANSHIILDDAYNYLRLRSLDGKHCTVSKPPVSASESSPSLPLSCSTAKELVEAGPPSLPKLLVVSAADQDGIRRIGSALQQYFESPQCRARASQQYLENLTHTLSNHRSKLSWRSFAVTKSVQQLSNLNTALVPPLRGRDVPLRIAFVFTGQGGQWSETCKRLMGYEAFRTSIEHADHYLNSLGCSWSITDLLTNSLDSGQMSDPKFSQTIGTVLQMALVDLLRGINVIPMAVVGHSSGEIAAAYCAGYLSCQSAWRLAYFRGMLSSELAHTRGMIARGSMLSVGLSEVDVKGHLSTLNSQAKDFGVCVACVNSPQNVTVSGEDELIDQLKQQLDERSIFARKLAIPVAYHSPQMQSVASRYVESIGSLTRESHFQEFVPMFSSVTGEQVSRDTLLLPQYWARNMVLPVEFRKAVSNMCSKSEVHLRKKLDMSHRSAVVVNYLLEIGPHGALQSSLRQILQSTARSQSVEYSSLFARGEAATNSLLTLIGQLWCAGHDVRLNVANRADDHPSEAPSLLVDLPEYPFEHSQRYWVESRLSKNYRFREYAPKEFLGVRSNDWNPNDARWRNFLSASDHPWIEHHKINGAILLPGTGMLVMVLEAAHELFGSHNGLAGYHLKDVSFERAMVFSTSVGNLETQVCLTRRDTSPEVYSFDFAIYSGTYEDWSRNCHGRLELDIEQAEDEWMQAERAAELSAVMKDLHSKISRCHKQIDTKQMYRVLERAGLNYGPSFRAASQQSVSDQGDAVAEIALFPFPDTDGAPVERRIVHPASLDSMLHICFTALSAGGSIPITTSVPSRIRGLWISKDGLSPSETESVTATSTVTNRTPHGFTASCGVISDTPTSQVRLVLDCLEQVNIAEPSTSRERSSETSKSYYYLDTKVALGKLSNTEIHSVLMSEPVLSADSPSFTEDLSLIQKVSLEHLLTSVDATKFQDTRTWQYHYLKWARHHLDRRQQLHLQDSSGAKQEVTVTPASFDEICSRVGSFNFKGQLFIEIARSLTSIFDGAVDPLKILFGTELGKQFYEEVSGRKHGAQISKYIDLLAHQSPGLEILEVGGGTGSGTRHFIDALRKLPDGDSEMLRCKRYTFSDVSSSFFEKAREEFNFAASQMRFKVLNVEEDYAAQGVSEGTCDVIVAMNVFHITTDLLATLRHARKALKVGGKLIISESFSPSSWQLGYVFGLLPGWWLGLEDGRCLSPLLSLEEWDQKLRQAGFSGNDVVLQESIHRDCHDPGFIISTAVEQEAPLSSFQPCTAVTVRVVVGQPSKAVEDLMGLISTSSHLRSKVRLIMSTIDEACSCPSLSSEYVVFLADLDMYFWDTLDEKTWSLLQQFVSRTKHLLWISGQQQNASPKYGLLDGFSRVMRSENYDLHIVTLLLDSPTTNSGHASPIAKLLDEMISAVPQQCYEQEYVVTEGKLCVRRIIEATSLQVGIGDRIGHNQTVLSPVTRASPFKLSPHASGKVQDIQYIEESRQKPSPDEIEIEVMAVSIDTTDLMVASGEVKSEGIGIFCAGIVSRTGMDAEVTPSDRVVVFGSGCFRSHLRVKQDRVLILPDSISFQAACAQVPALVAAYYGLVKVGKLNKQDTVMIQGGSTVVGAAAIQICQQFGVEELFTTAVDQKERDHILQESNLPSKVVLSHSSFKRRIQYDSKNGAVDLVLAVGSDTPRNQGMDCVRPFGRAVVIESGIHSPWASPAESLNLPSNATFSSIELRTLIDAHPSIWRECLQNALDHVTSTRGTIRSPDNKVYPASDVVGAFESLRGARHLTGAVVDLEGNSEISIQTEFRPSYVLGNDATYIVVGGLGGIGRELSRWLCDKGARHLILLSRSGPRTVEACELLKELRAQGVVVEAPAVDVANTSALRTVLEGCSQRMPPFKGCIHAGGILNDVVFQNMSLREWNATVDVKAAGAWNLHELLPSNLDFFVCISSMQGIVGGVTCANYAAANTYLDALAHYRIARGERAVSVCLGAVGDVGYLAGHASLRDRLQASDVFVFLDRHELRALMDIYCDPDTPLSRSPTGCQPIMGIKSPSHVLADGAELPFTMCQPMWQHMHHIPINTNTTDPNTSNHSDNSTTNIISALATTTTVPEASALVVRVLGQRMAKILGVPEDRLDELKPLRSYGVDSLSAIELRNWVARTFDVDIAVFDILGGGAGATAQGFATRIASETLSRRAAHTTPVEEGSMGNK